MMFGGKCSTFVVGQGGGGQFAARPLAQSTRRRRRDTRRRRAGCVNHAATGRPCRAATMLYRTGPR